MAVKKQSKKIVEPMNMDTPVETARKSGTVKCEVCNCSCSGRWANVGWGLLLAGGLAHMLPQQVEPLLRWSAYGVSVQMAVGAISVVLALYFLLGE